MGYFGEGGWRKQTRSKLAAPLEDSREKNRTHLLIYLSVWRFELGRTAWIHWIRLWIRYFWPERRRASKEWRHSSPLKQKKFHTTSRAGKLMFTVFWNYKGPILEKQYAPVNYYQQRSMLWPAWEPLGICIHIKTSLSSSVLLQHDNTRSHTTHATVQNVWSAFHILHVHLTSHHLIILCLDASERC